MKINADDIINFVIANGETASVTMKDIEYVGIENIIYYANEQLTSNLEEHTDKNEMLFDFFCGGCFDNLYDRVYSGLMC